MSENHKSLHVKSRNVLVREYKSICTSIGTSAIESKGRECVAANMAEVGLGGTMTTSGEGTEPSGEASGRGGMGLEVRESTSSVTLGGRCCRNKRTLL